MSQSPAKSVSAEQAADYRSAWDQILQWTKQGRSWSGRERNSFFLNTRDGRFAAASAAMGLDFSDDGRGVATVDWDNDGDVDLWTSARSAPRLRFLQNQYSSAGHFITVRLQGDLDNRDAIGARVVLRSTVTKQSGTKRSEQTKSLRAGEGYLSQSSKRIHFGLGDSESPVDLEIRWPDGSATAISRLAVDQHYEITQGTNEARLWKRPQPASALYASKPKPARGAANSAVLLASRHNFPLARYFSDDGQTAGGELQDVRPGGTRPRLVVQWSSTCAPCLVELRELTRQADTLKAAGIDVLALSVDGLGPLADLATEPGQILKKMQFPFDSGRATLELLNSLQQANNELFSVWRPLRLPSSFLFDREGRLAAIYQGRLDIGRLLQDVQSLSLSGDALLAAAVPREGHWQSPPRGLRMSPHIARGVAEANQGRWQEALEAFEAAREETPDSVEAYLQMGRALDALGQGDAAIEALQHALKLTPDFATAHAMLGDLYFKNRQPESALNHFRAALVEDGRNGELLTKTGVIYAGQGNLPEAIRSFRSAVDAAPQVARYRSNLGKALLDSRAYATAKQTLDEALRLSDPPLAAQVNLALVLAAAPQAEVRDGPRAVALAEQCLQRSGRGNSTVLGHLAAAYAEIGDFPRAREANASALQIARRQKRKSQMADLSAKAALYEQQQPFRLPAAD